MFAGILAHHAHFYPRSPCGERRASNQRERQAQHISIHALLAESDYTTTITICTALKFLSTLSLRRATIVSVGLLMFNSYFYPRSPCGERPEPENPIVAFDNDFYPRSPCGERPYIIGHAVNLHPISIHALLAESDLIRYRIKARYTNFYPRSPCGERLASLT